MKKKDLIEILETGTWSEKIKTASELLDKFDTYSSEIIIGLTDDDADVRYWCLKILTEKNQEKFGSFAETLVEDENWFVRCQAIYSLFLCDKNKYSKVIEKALSNEKDEEAKDFLEKNIVL
ncbi:MAG: HEAT repeat domain-containing protein [Candidatus Muirbacterium halophilum]|nr:HEAT repeat domain-containing protein [Candidatus Muirbacterium halophilum]MCK9474702.1 HEAT repeat domain-containing protein [Candidatus Muirbacterium halophilum]